MSKFLFDRIEHFANTIGFAPAIMTEKKLLTFHTLNNLLLKCVRQLTENNIQQGDRIAIYIPEPMTNIVFTLALMRMGCTHISLAPDCSHTVNESMLQNCRVKALICTNTDITFSTPQIFVDLPKAIQSSHTIDIEDYPYNPDHTAIVNIGSGTVNEPKLIPTTFKTLDILLKRDVSIQNINLFDRYLALSPANYYTPKRRLITSICCGATAVLLQNLQQPILQACQYLKIDHLLLTPFRAKLLVDAIKDKNIKQPRLPALKTIYLTSSPASEQLRQELMTYLSPNLLIGYGTNEFAPITFASPEIQENRPGTVGKPVCKDTKIEIVDDNGKLLPQGESGHIRLKGPGMFEGYEMDKADSTSKMLRNGWFYPGDLGKIDADGCLTFLGRSDDIILHAGSNISPREIETTLELHPDVAEAAVFPIKINDDIHVPAAAVALTKDCDKNSVTTQTLDLYCKEHLGWKKPSIIQIFDSLPRNKTDKILKKELQKEILESLSGKISKTTEQAEII